ncbi:TIGR02453 family protein [Yoonia sp. R2331]|uniref:TIGR02453 family protein n=1 Tax=Yoonia sp. R2331 TaxID=3237238 RepID=UPI0034E59E27
MSELNSLIGDARDFLGQLAQNNSRDWWQDNKATYDAKLKTPALALLDQMQPKLKALSGLEAVPKLFRPHRDVRFSKDKTPYTTHLHMLWRLDTGARQDAVFFFGVGLDYITAGAGMMGFDKAVLADWRKFVDLDTDRIAGVVTGLERKGVHFRDPELKRVPPPFDKDHAGARLLRMKGVVGHLDLPESGPLEAQLTKAFTTLWPLNEMLIGIAEA